MLAALPDWMDLDAFKYGTAGLTVALVLAAVGVLVWVRRVGWRVWTVVILLVAAGGVFYYRTTLEDCEKTCDCKFINDRIKIDGCPAPLNEDEDEEFEFGHRVPASVVPALRT